MSEPVGASLLGDRAPAAGGAPDAVRAPVAPSGLPALPATGLALAGGLVMVPAFPGTNAWPLAPVAVAALALATRGQRARRGAWLGMITGLAFFAPHLHWTGVYVGALPWAALSVLEACFVALLGTALPAAWRAPGGRAGTSAAIACLWVAQEALRGRVPFGGFPWGRLAFSQADAPTLGYAALGGAPLISAAVAAAGALLAVAVVELSDRDARGARRAGIALAAAVAVVAGGALVPRPIGAARTVAVAAVQGNVPAPGLEFNARRRAVLDNHVRATLALAAQVASGRAARPDLVLWPENASDIDPLRNPDAYLEIQRAVDAVGVDTLVGALLNQPAGHLSNVGIVWHPSSSATPGPGATYVKRHPVPFGEYIPDRSFFRLFSHDVDLVREDFVAGPTVGVLAAGGVRIGDVICFEVAYDSLVRDTVRAGADLLVVQTNNATFGYTPESVQQLAMSRIAAVATGRSVVHISTVGVSALIMPDGSMIARSGQFDQEVLTGRLPLRTAQTVATRLDGWPEMVLAALGLLLALAGTLRGRRRQPVAPGGADDPAGPDPRDPVEAPGGAGRR